MPELVRTRAMFIILGNHNQNFRAPLPTAYACHFTVRSG